MLSSSSKVIKRHKHKEQGTSFYESTITLGLENRLLSLGEGASMNICLNMIPGGGHGNPTPVFLPGESYGQGAWQAAIHGVAKSRTGLKRLHTHTVMA